MSLTRTGLVAFIAIMAATASAEISLSQLVVELGPQARARDVEIYNDADERSFVTIEPRRIDDPGQPTEKAVTSGDPEKLGILVSPRKLILEPHQRRLIRIADISSDRERERVYRITVKPQVGEVTSKASGLKLLVGYDMLVLARPDTLQPPKVSAKRVGKDLIISNNGNSSVELDGGKQCRVADNDCHDLGSKRLYAGASWTVKTPYETSVRFKLRSGGTWSDVTL